VACPLSNITTEDNGGFMSKEKKRTLGDVINELSGKPAPLKIAVGQETFNLFIHPPSQETLATYYSMVDLKDQNSDANKKADRVLICETVRDVDGNKVWEKPEDIKVESFVYNQINLAVSQRVFGLRLSDFAVKNSPDSPSSTPA